jgi:hypothetical protein
MCPCPCQAPSQSLHLLRSVPDKSQLSKAECISKARLRTSFKSSCTTSSRSHKCRDCHKPSTPDSGAAQTKRRRRRCHSTAKIPLHLSSLTVVDSDGREERDMTATAHTSDCTVFDSVVTTDRQRQLQRAHWPGAGADVSPSLLPPYPSTLSPAQGLQHQHILYSILFYSTPPVSSSLRFPSSISCRGASRLQPCLSHPSQCALSLTALPPSTSVRVARSQETATWPCGGCCRYA